MNLYLISQSQENGYDTYDSAVVAAKTAKAARETHPSIALIEPRWGDSWASNPKYVTAELIGKAKPKTEAGVICASFNAG